MPQDPPNPRERLAGRLAALRAASGLKQEAAAAGATRRLDGSAPPGERVRKITGQRISDWETGKNLPASERELGALVRVLIEHVRRRSHDTDLPAELLDETNWPRWWREAQDLPKPAGDPESPAWAGGPPYLGMKPFGEGDSEVFFGREQTCRELAAMLSERVSKPGLLLVFGPSGAGKSSLLRAGLLDHLAREGLPGLPEAARWPRRVMSPTGDPLGQLAVHLAALTAGDALAIREGLRSRPGDAHLLFQQASMSESEQGRVVLVVDQFEEIFTLASEAHDDASVKAFVTAMHAAATTPTGPSRAPAALVVVVVRSDFLDRCGRYMPLKESQRAGVFPLIPMTDSELLRAITGPAARAGLTVEGGLADLVLADLRASGSEPATGVGALPLLSQAMLATWHHRDGTSLTIAGYGAAGGVATAVQTSAVRAYSLLTEKQQALMRHITQRLTVMTAEGHWARRRTERAELLAGHSGEDMAEVEVVLDRFVEQRLMVADSEGAIELAHDLLLTTWPTLAGWLEEDREGRIILDQIQERAATWRRDSHDPSHLYRGQVLASARSAIDRQKADPGRYPPATDLVEEFMAACDQAQAHDARLAVRLRRLGRAAVTALVILTVVSVTAAVIAVNRQALSETRRKEATSRLLTAQGDRLKDGDPVVAGLLAAAASRLSPTPQSRYGMLVALATSTQGVLEGHTGGIHVTAFNRAGTMLATGDNNGFIRLWDPVRKQPLGNFKAHNVSVDMAAFSPDGSVLATGGSPDSAVRLWDPRTSLPVGTLDVSGDGPTALAFSPDGSMLAVISKQSLQLWDPTTRRRLPGPPDLDRHAQILAFSPDGTTLAVGDEDGVVRLLDPITWKQLARFTGHTTWIAAMAFTPDGSMLATGDDLNVVRLWNLTKRQPNGSFTTPVERLRAMAFSPDGSMLAVGSFDDEIVRLWDPATRKEIGALRGHTGGVRALAFSPSGLLATGSDNGTVRLWAASTWRPARTIKIGNGSVSVLAYPRDGSLLATGSSLRGGVQLWEPATGAEVGVLGAKADPIRALDFSPDSSMLATGGSTAQLWDTATWRPGDSFPSDETMIDVIAFSPDGSMLAVGDGSSIQLWNLRTRRLIGALKAPGSSAYALAFSPDSSILAVGGQSETVPLWNPATLRQVGELSGHVDSVHAMAFNPTGTVLATGDARGTVRLWNAATRRPQGELNAHSNGVFALAFSPDGSILASAGWGKVVRLWDPVTRGLVQEFNTQHDSVFGLAFAPEGTMLAVGVDGEAQLWQLNVPGDLVRAVCGVAGRSLTRREWQLYLPPNEPYRSICP